MKEKRAQRKSLTSAASKASKSVASVDLNSSKKSALPDDFVSVARRLGADEDKDRFERQLTKIAKAKVSAPIKGSRAR
jgi:hypothetical protein